jgi:hypothetical protein
MKLRSKIVLTVTTASVLSLSAVGAIAAATGTSDSDGAVAVTAFAEPADDSGNRTVSLRGDVRARGSEVAEFLGLTPEELREQISGGATLAEVAESLGVNPQSLVDYMVDEATAKVQEQVANGRIDQERADQLIANLSQRINTFVFEGPQERPDGGEYRRPHRGPRQVIGTAAEVIGIEPADLVAALQDGQTIADVAAANGSSGDAVVAAIVANADEKLQEAVDNGRITAEEKAEKLAQMTERLTEAVNTVHEPRQQPAGTTTSL